MKKLFLILVLGFIFSNAAFANIVPCNEPKCNKKDHFTLTKFIGATEINNMFYVV